MIFFFYYYFLVCVIFHLYISWAVSLCVCVWVGSHLTNLVTYCVSLDSLEITQYNWFISKCSRLYLWCYYNDVAAPPPVYCLSETQQHYFSHFSVLNNQVAFHVVETHQRRVSLWGNEERGCRSGVKSWSEGERQWDVAECRGKDRSLELWWIRVSAMSSESDCFWGSPITTTRRVSDHRRWEHDKKSKRRRRRGVRVSATGHLSLQPRS